jgi:hypothetical protein
MATTRSLASAGPQALFEALLAGNEAKALRLLRSSAAERLSHAGPAGFSTLHAAAVGRCAGALPALVAAGAPLDAVLGDDCEDAHLDQFLKDRGGQSIPRLDDWRACSALALAARCVNIESSTQQLLP